MTRGDGVRRVLEWKGFDLCKWFYNDMVVASRQGDDNFCVLICKVLCSLKMLRTVIQKKL